MLPTDVVVAPEFAPTRRATVVAADAIPADQLGLDIGPESGARIRCRARRRQDGLLERADGRLRDRRRSPRAPRAVAQALTEIDGLSVVGGGDSAAAVRQLGFADDQFGHISTGGGASLEYLEGKTLPGIDVLED